MEKNVIVAKFSQHLTSVNKNGEVITFDQEQEFFGETTQAMTAKHIGIWLLGQVKHFMVLQRLQGKTGFKMSKDIELELTVNRKTEKFGFKFSLSLKKMEGLIIKTPALVQAALVPAASIGKVIASTERAIDNLFEKGNIVIAPAIKKALEVIPVEAGN